MRHHKHFHKRQDESSGWDKFVEGFGDIFNENDDTTTPAVVVKAPATVFKTVYETQSKTFDGEIGGWSTVGAAEATEKSAEPTTTEAALTTAESKPTTTAQSEAEPTTEKPAAKTTAETTKAKTTPEAAQLNTADSTLPSSVVPTKSIDVGDHTTLALATSELTTPTPTTADATDVSTTLGKGAAGETSATASATAEATSDSSSSSAGAKAGIAFGVLGGILVVGLLVWFLFNKRRSQMEKERVQEQNNEKISGAFAGRPVSFHERPVSVQTSRTSATAPQLSLRPVTQFMPNFGERRSSKGAAMALNLASNQNMSENRGPPTGNSLWERPSTGHSNHPDNPFRDNGPATPNNPFDAPENVVGMATTTNSPPRSGTGADIAAAAVAGAAVGGTGLTRKTSIRKESPAPLDLTRHVPMSPVPPSPAGTEFSQSEVSPGQSPGPSQSAAAIAAAGGPAQTVVHRVQLEFVPTLDDEMGLKAGQLVRLLHELCASDLTDRNKVSCRERACPLDPLSRDLLVPLAPALPSTLVALAPMVLLPTALPVVPLVVPLEAHQACDR
ncbi:putative sh3 domain protein [Eutypa lata UCREL1]|uniref:Putative sh3 domain protein n=1 Tax=Eutypa lata (strain UCR-EL1) TaxID=1287681 RepID=M7SYY5_EUTLA|nr:putative sh3 domain protein [Eutypa lata UCREL1]